MGRKNLARPRAPRSARGPRVALCRRPSPPKSYFVDTWTKYDFRWQEDYEHPVTSTAVGPAERDERRFTGWPREKNMTNGETGKGCFRDGLFV